MATVDGFAVTSWLGTRLLLNTIKTMTGPVTAQNVLSAFNHLGEAYLDDPDPNPFIVFWTYDHPSIQGRAIFAAQYNPWAAGQQPRFFSK